MKEVLAQWSLILLCFSMAAAIGGGFYEYIVLTPMWSSSPPSSFSIIQPRTGVPLQRFWIPVHMAITVFLLLSIFLAWGDTRVRLLLLVGLASYIVMRIWSGLYFILYENFSQRSLQFKTENISKSSKNEAIWILSKLRDHSKYQDFNYKHIKEIDKTPDIIDKILPALGYSALPNSPEGFNQLQKRLLDQVESYLKLLLISIASASYKSER